MDVRHLMIQYLTLSTESARLDGKMKLHSERYREAVAAHTRARMDMEGIDAALRAVCPNWRDDAEFKECEAALRAQEARAAGAGNGIGGSAAETAA